KQQFMQNIGIRDIGIQDIDRKNRILENWDLRNKNSRNWMFQEILQERDAFNSPTIISSIALSPISKSH
ncbi:18908_t:CDS:2, partial [Rhizophagus irregularis]